MATQTISSSTDAVSYFSQAQFIPPDAIFALTAQYLEDSHPQKVNLGQGTYRDADGKPWVLPSVNEARESLLARGLNHEYLPIAGLPAFREATAELVMGQKLLEEHRSTIATCQSLSGTGALHLAGLLLRASSTSIPKVYIPSPTWPNHHQVFESLGFACESFRYYDPEKKRLDLDSYYSMLQMAEPKSVVILHACAHNPTGFDPSKDQWRRIARLMRERQLFPLFDAAYLGFNSGSIDEDAFAIRLFIGEMQTEAGVCVSFAKNMGLYGERVGCVVLSTKTEKAAVNTQSMLEMLQRSEVSNPPAFGAKIASEVLNNHELRQMWYADMISMSGRIRSMRWALYQELVSLGAPGTWDHLVQQSGMFGFLGLSPEVVLKLREHCHIYMADNSRISIAGLNPGNVGYVARSISQCLEECLNSGNGGGCNPKKK